MRLCRMAAIAHTVHFISRVLKRALATIKALMMFERMRQWHAVMSVAMIMKRASP